MLPICFATSAAKFSSFFSMPSPVSKRTKFFTLRSEDTEAMNNGFEFMIDNNTEIVRYLRFVMINNFTGGTDVHISEIHFFGDDSLDY